MALVTRGRIAAIGVLPAVRPGTQRSSGRSSSLSTPSLPRGAHSPSPIPGSAVLAGVLASRAGRLRHLSVRSQLPSSKRGPGRLACSEAARPQRCQATLAQRGAREPAGRVLPPRGSRRGSSSSPRRHSPPGRGSAAVRRPLRVSEDNAGCKCPSARWRARTPAVCSGGQTRNLGTR